MRISDWSADVCSSDLQNYSKALTTRYNTDSDGNRTTIHTPGYDITGIKGNSNYGYLNGEGLAIRKNYYHKPVANFNWDFEINEKSSMSTVLYASLGRGGGKIGRAHV